MGEKKRLPFLSEFKTFIKRGNIIDLAIGLTVGTAFTSVARSLTSDLLMPLIGSLMGGIDFTGLRIPLWNAKAVIDAAGQVQYDAYGQILYESALYYGRFIQSVLDFLLIALVIFMFVKISKIRIRAKVKEQPAPPAVESKEVALLQEIRDLLKEKTRDS